MIPFSGKELFREIQDLKSGLSGEILERHFNLQPELKAIYTEKQITSYKQDVGYHLDFLAESIRAGDIEIYLNFIQWAKTFFTSIGIPDHDMINFYGLLKESLVRKISGSGKEVIANYLDEGIKRYGSTIAEVQGFIDDSKDLGRIGRRFLNHLLRGERDLAGKLVMSHIEAGVSVKEIYLGIFQPVQYEIGRLWQTNKINVAQEHYCTASTQHIMSLMYPYIFESEKIGKSLIAASVSGELHEVGIRMIADIFEIEGWDTYYLGANTPSESLIATIKDFEPDIVAISATMTYHIEHVRDMIRMLEGISLSKEIKVLVGGYPFKISGSLWKDVGAHGSAMDAVGALEIARTLVN
jgi:methanogenic corrinoid protein MtbC1